MAPQIALRDCSEAVGWRLVYLWFWWLGMYAIKHIFFRMLLPVTRRRRHQEGIYCFSDMKKCKNCTYKISPWEHLTLWRPVLPVSWEHGVPHFLLSTLSTSQGRLKVSRARRASFLLSTLNTSQGRGLTAAHNLILVEADGVHQGKYQFVIDNTKHFIPSSRVQKSTTHSPSKSCGHFRSKVWKIISSKGIFFLSSLFSLRCCLFHQFLMSSLME